MNSHNCIQERSLLAQGEGTRTQSLVLMKGRMAVVIELSILLGLLACIPPPGCRELPNIPVLQQHRNRRELAFEGLVRPLRLAALSLCTAMPRLRGTPRRGAAWHAAKSRRQRKEKFDRAIAIATRRRRARGMAIIEEELPTDSIERPPTRTLLSVTTEWHLCTHSVLNSTPGMASGTSSQGDTGEEEPYTPCYIEEEVPPKPTGADTADKEQGATADNALGMARGTGSQDDTGNEEPYSPCYIEEEVPPALTEEDRADNARGATADSTSAQPLSVEGGYLNLIFEVRNLLADQTFRIERLEQRLDMFFAAHSRATQKKQCPTCARAYAFPTRWRHTMDNDTPTGSEVT